jgi:dTDP-glucose 4,6-dehydratase
MSVMIVTGGAGFIGSNFVRHMLTGEHRIVVVDKLTYAGNYGSIAELEANPDFTFEHADITDKAAMESIFRRYKPDRVVNFAAESHVDRSIDDADPFIETNIRGVYVLLEQSRRYLAQNRDKKPSFRFLHVSTDEVYGSLGKTGLFTEQTPYSPNSPYAASKASSDHLVRAYRETYGLPVVITNCSNNYGPYQFPEKLIPLTLLNAMEAKPLPIYGDGSNVRDWLYVEDHCSGIALVLERGRTGEKYNIGGNNERTNLEIVHTLCDVLEGVCPAAKNAAMKASQKSTYRDLITYVDDRPGHDKRYAIDASYIQQELRWKPKHNFESGIVETVHWYLDNPKWCHSVLSGDYARQRLGTG